jgi:DNA-binding IscR family transcriptional regulator
MIPLIDIVKAIDGDDLFVSCGLGIKHCSAKRPCPIHYEYKAIRDEIITMLKTNTIQDLAMGLVSGDTFLVKK